MWARLCVSMRVPLAATIPDALICRFDTARTVVRMPYNKAVFTTPQKSPPLTHASWFRKDRHHGVRWLRQHSRLRARGRALQELLDEKDDDSDSVTTETGEPVIDFMSVFTLRKPVSTV